MEPPNAEEALDRLKQGNERFRTGRAQGPDRSGLRHEELIRGQQPFAIILTCSDSRVPPEIVFDGGLGELFVIRVAGNVASQSAIASIEYAVANLGTKLVVVMAHQSCGAVGAAIAGGAPSKSLSHLISFIQPALDQPNEDVDVVARRSARINAERLITESDIIRAATQESRVRIVTAFFHFSNGEAEFDNTG